MPTDKIKNFRFYPLCTFFLNEHLEIGNPVIGLDPQENLIAEWSDFDLKLQINIQNLDTMVFLDNKFDQTTNLYNFGNRYLLKRHIHNYINESKNHG